jgi:SNW domain-containing protein 1
MAQALKKEEQIRKMATLAKAEKAQLMADSLKDEPKVGDKRGMEQRSELMAERRREIVRDERMNRAGIKKSKTERDGERDISEKIALG